MDTKLAKNYTIIFLLILNILLFFLNFSLKEKYKMTREQEKIIISYLEQENVKIYTTLPKKYYPMPQITMKKNKQDDLILQKIFFENTENLLSTKKFEDTVFTQGYKTLTINNLFVRFEDLTPKENFQYNKQNCFTLIENYKKNMQKQYGKLYLDNVFEEEEYFLINYTKKVSGHKIFNNIFTFKVYKNGDIQIYFTNYEKPEEITDKINICSADEAMYTFVKEIKNLIPDKEIYIKQIDLGYYLKPDDENITFSFLPYYRFYIQSSKTPFYVNAYTNTFEYESTPIEKMY